MKVMRYSTQIKLYNNYFDKNGRLSAKSILGFFQGIASYHAEEIGVGHEFMQQNNLYWVISKVKFDVVKNPEINQDVIIETWPHEKGRIDFIRDYRITDIYGNVLVIGSSEWCVIDAITRRLMRTDNINYNGEAYNKSNYEDKFTKIRLMGMELEYKYTHKVMPSEIDTNKHMNNTNYANVVYNVIENRDISHFELNYLSECLEGEELKVYWVSCNSEEFVEGKVGEKTAIIAKVY